MIELRQISKYIPEVKDRFFIDNEGNLYTDFGERKLNNIHQQKGYIKNCLVLKNGKQKSFFRHRLVMICFNFIEDYDKYQVNHIDGNKENNCLDNLEWCTNQENRIHAVKNGLAASMIGETNPSHKLSEDDVLKIIEGLKNKVPGTELAKQFNCSKSTISSIKNKRNWTYLTEGIDFN